MSKENVKPIEKPESNPFGGVSEAQPEQSDHAAFSNDSGMQEVSLRVERNTGKIDNLIKEIQLLEKIVKQLEKDAERKAKWTEPSTLIGMISLAIAIFVTSFNIYSSANKRIDGANKRIDQIYQFLLPKQSNQPVQHKAPEPAE